MSTKMSTTLVFLAGLTACQDTDNLGPIPHADHGDEVEHHDSGAHEADTGWMEGGDTEMIFPDEEGGVARATSGWHTPISGLPTYDCTYASGSGRTYTTLWADNQDGGATARASSSYSGSYCDYYDGLSGIKYNAQFCGSHPGVDIGTSSTTAYAIGGGKVYEAKYSSSWGYYVTLEIAARTSSGKSVTIYVTYAHLTYIDSSVTKGSTVSKGQVLGKTGNTGRSTGPHLHFQIDKSSAPFKPYWPTGAPNTVDWSASLASYTYNPLTAIGFGTCY